MESNTKLTQTKDILCPTCGKCAKFDISEYKILLQCKSKEHNIGNLFFNEFEETQVIAISKIICDECGIKKNANPKIGFYRCHKHKRSLCDKCKDELENNNNNGHSFINYDERNYKCSLHNETFIFYCKTCKQNNCLDCENLHKMHDIIYYEKMFPDINYLKKEITNLRNDINKFKEIIITIIDINKANRIYRTIESFYNIYKKICDSIINHNLNYELFYSYDKLKNSGILNDIYHIIINKNNRFEIINEIHNKITTKFCEEINIQYKIPYHNIEIKLFGFDFINGN